MALLSLVVTIVLALMGSIVGRSFLDNLSGVTLLVPTGLPSEVQGLGPILTVSGLPALLLPAAEALRIVSKNTG